MYLELQDEQNMRDLLKAIQKIGIKTPKTIVDIYNNYHRFDIYFQKLKSHLHQAELLGFVNKKEIFCDQFIDYDYSITDIGNKFLNFLQNESDVNEALEMKLFLESFKYGNQSGKGNFSIVLKKKAIELGLIYYNDGDWLLSEFGEEFLKACENDNG